MPALPLRHLPTPVLASLLVCAVPAYAAPVEEDILVTASRVQEDALKMPLSWSTVSEETLSLVDPVHINEIMQRVPGAWISRGNGQESIIALRSPVLTGSGSCGAFFSAADGISLRAPGFCNVNQLFDSNFEQAGRIEVIRGPATALYGSSAMHGVINVISAAPTEELDSLLSVEGGPDNYFRAKYRYSDTVGRNGISVSTNATHDGGYKDDSGYDQQKAIVRHDYNGQDWDFRTVLDTANLKQDTAGYIEGYKAYNDSDSRKDNPNPNAYRDAWSVRLYSAASVALNNNSRLTLTPYLRVNEMQFLQHFLPWQPEEKNAHNSLGLRTTVNTDAGVLRWTNGIDLEYTDATLKETQDEDFSPNQPIGVHYDYQVDASVAALYSQLRTQFNSPWELDAGVRFEYTNYDYNNRTGDGAPCEPSADACRFYRPADREDDFSNWSLNVGASYSLSEDHIIYMRYAHGFRAPEASELYRLQSGQQSADLDSEKIDNVEIGLRGYWQRNTRYDVAVYYMNKEDVIFQDADRQNVSGAQTNHYGAEMSVDFLLTDNWSVGIDANYASHTYDNTIELLGSSGNINGNDIDTSPKAFGSARLGWDFSSLVNRNSRAELEWVYMDSYFLEPENEHEYNGHSLLNLRITSDLTPRWSAGLRLTNLLDVEYAERADFGFGEYRYFVGQPRGAYVQISYQFGG
ncbi:Vitamin B12 transporter BtuB [Halioglobus japonicus]|nr:Vitamin B12 transporter BtuB [Halioglobus japonicus]